MIYALQKRQAEIMPFGSASGGFLLAKIYIAFLIELLYNIIEMTTEWSVSV